MRLLSVDARATGRDRPALAALIESAEADVACVHHGPRLLRWRSISAALGRRSGLVVVTGGRVAGANLVLSTLGVDALAWRDADWSGGPTRPAGAALAALAHGSQRFVVASAGLAGDDHARAEQAGRLIAGAAELVPEPLPTVLSVDGVRPGSAAWIALTADHLDVDGRVFVARNLGRTTSSPLGAAATAVVVDITAVG